MGWGGGFPVVVLWGLVERALKKSWENMWSFLDWKIEEKGNIIWMTWLTLSKDCLAQSTRKPCYAKKKYITRLTVSTTVWKRTYRCLAQHCKDLKTPLRPFSSKTYTVQYLTGSLKICCRGEEGRERGGRMRVDELVEVDLWGMKMLVILTIVKKDVCTVHNIRSSYRRRSSDAKGNTN